MPGVLDGGVGRLLGREPLSGRLRGGAGSRALLVRARRDDPAGGSRPSALADGERSAGSLAYRELLLPRFAPAAVARLESDVREFAASLVDGVASAGRADLYETLAKPLPLLMITRLLGIERDDLFWEWVELLMYGRVEGVDPETIVATAEALYDFLADQLEQRRAAPGDDLLSLLLEGDVNGRPYTQDEILDLAFFLVIAGIENTAFSIRATLRHLAVHPDDRAALAADPGLINNVVEQSLRLYAPVTGLSRTAACDTSLGGQRSGAEIACCCCSVGESRRDGVRGRRRFPPQPARRPTRRVRHRPAPLRRLAPGASRDPHRRRGAAPQGSGLRAHGPRPRLVRRRPAGSRLADGCRGQGSVRVSLDRSACVGHAQCSAICPAVFSNDELGYAIVHAEGVVPPGAEEDAQLAVDSCPEQAIHVAEP